MKKLAGLFQDSDFEPHPLLRSGHAQTCFAALWAGKQLPYRARQHLIPTTHGDQLVLHDDQPDGWQAGDTVVVLAHGLGGSHRSPYMVRIAEKLRARGVRALRLDLRGAGVGDRLARHAGHAGRSEDIAAAAEFVARLCPLSPRVAIGFSLGGNLLLKWLGETGQRDAAGPTGKTGFCRVMTVCAPIDLVWCAQNMLRSSRMVYSRWFVRSLLRQVRRRRIEIPELARIDLAPPPRSLYEFDDRITAPWSGFSGAEEYYTRSSPVAGLAAIQTPTVLLTAADDPLVPVEMYRQARVSDAVEVKITAHGGHVGFVGRGDRDPDWYWLDWRVVDFAANFN